MKPYQRHNARSFAIQAIYEWLVSGNDVASIKAHFLEDYNFNKTDLAYFSELLNGVTTNTETLDNYMLQYLDRPINKLNLIELCILRMAIYELDKRLDVPYRVVINEAVELAKKFGVTDGHKYVNSILDQVAKDIRNNEIY
jgi:N utilization substance protein B